MIILFSLIACAPNQSVQLNKARLKASRLGNYDEAIRYHEKALAIDLKTHGADHPSVASLWNNLGEAAIGYLEKALASDLKSFGHKHRHVASDWNNLGTTWHYKREYDKAIEYFEKAVASDVKILGIDHPTIAKE